VRVVYGHCPPRGLPSPVAPSSPVQPSLSPISKQSRRGVRSRCTRSKPRNCTSKGSNGRARERSFELKIGWDSSIVFLRVVWCARLPSIQSVKARICQTKLITSKHACRRTQIFTLFFFFCMGRRRYRGLAFFTHHDDGEDSVSPIDAS
jgi:hypothetical protein